MRPYPKLWRQLVLATCDGGVGTREAAKRFHCSEAWIRRIKQQRRELCKVGPHKTRIRNPGSATLRQRLYRLIAEDPGITVAQLDQVYGPELNVGMLVGIRERLSMLENIYWYGAEGCLPPDWITEQAEATAAAGWISHAKWVLKKQIKELIIWRPETTVEELQTACGQELNARFLTSIRDELSFFGHFWQGADASPLLSAAPLAN